MPNDFVENTDANLIEDFFIKESFYKRNVVNLAKKYLPKTTLLGDSVKHRGAQAAHVGLYLYLSPVLFLEYAANRVGNYFGFAYSQTFHAVYNTLALAIENTIKRPRRVTQDGKTMLDAKNCALQFRRESMESVRTLALSNSVQGIDLSWNFLGLKNSTRTKLINELTTINGAEYAHIKALSLRGNHLAYNVGARSAIKAIFQAVPAQIETLDLRDNYLSKLSVKELTVLRGTLPSLKNLYVSLDEVNIMSNEQWDALNQIVSNSSSNTLVIFDRNNRPANQVAKHKCAIIDNAVALNYLAGSIVTVPSPLKSVISNPMHTASEKKFQRPLPFDIIKIIASYFLFSNEITPHLNDDPRKTHSFSVTLFMSMLGTSIKPKSTNSQTVFNFLGKSSPLLIKDGSEVNNNEILTHVENNLPIQAVKV